MEKPTSHRLATMRAAPLPVRLALIAIVGGGGAVTAYSIVPPEDMAIIRQVDVSQFVPGSEFAHQDQAELNREAQMVQGVAARREALFVEAFEHGDVLFDTAFNALDGGGAFVTNQQRYTRFPRTDQRENGWFTHAPGRSTGPNGGACSECHLQGAADGAGPAAANVHRDPFRTGVTENFIQRNAPALHGMAAKQLLGEQATRELLARRNQQAADCNCTSAARSNPPCAARRVALNNILAQGQFQGIDFGFAIVSRKPGATACTMQVLPPTGGTTRAVSDDLIVRPFQWKGSVATVRDFNRGAAHNELGMQADEFFDRDNVDGDRDGVGGELTVGDITTLTLYIAGQPRPTSKVELNQIRGNNPELAALIGPLPQAEIASINRGETVFNQLGCNTCHVPTLTLGTRIFAEPSLLPDYRDRLFPGGRLPSELGLLASNPVIFDITSDQPDNKFQVGVGQNAQSLGSFQRQGQNGAVVNFFGDLRRHDLGQGLAEPVDEVGTGKSIFITTPLWGVGSSAPYLHDGRAVTLTEAILWHQGEAAMVRQRFVQASLQQKRDLVNFLNNLIIFLPEEEEEKGGGVKEPPPGGGGGGGGMVDPA
jgi:hypothetical protein